MEETQSPSTPSTKISALVLSYNNVAGLRRCLTALEASTARAAMEIIVIDNGSFDGSGTLDSEFPGVTFLRLPRNFGATKALNIAMRTAVGDYFLYLSTRMEVASEAVRALADRLDNNPDAVAACPLVVDDQGRPGGDTWKLPDAAMLKTHWRDPDSLPRMTTADGTIEYAGRSALMARKFFVRGLNYFDERFGEFGADLDLAFQIRRAGKKTVLVDEARVHGGAQPGWPDSAATVIAADRANGVAVFLSKHYGFMAGIGFRVSAALAALVRLQLGLFAAIAAGNKVDGSQGGL